MLIKNLFSFFKLIFCWNLLLCSGFYYYVLVVPSLISPLNAHLHEAKCGLVWVYEKCSLDKNIIKIYSIYALHSQKFFLQEKFFFQHKKLKRLLFILLLLKNKSNNKFLKAFFKNNFTKKFLTL